MTASSKSSIHCEGGGNITYSKSLKGKIVECTSVSGKDYNFHYTEKPLVGKYFRYILLYPHQSFKFDGQKQTGLKLGGGGRD